MRQIFYMVSAAVFAVIAITSYYYIGILWGLLIALPLFVIGLLDVFYSRSNVLKNYPVIGHLRYLLEFISPEIHQYFVEGSLDGRPYSREQRKMVYQRANKRIGTLPFGTQRDFMAQGVEFAQHSLAPVAPENMLFRIKVGGDSCEQPYDASRLNISGMSFGALSANAIRALNRGAWLGNFFHNTGEGGLSDYHLEHGGDICWQIGTGYFGCRTEDGRFDPQAFRKQATLPQVKLIELKLSQGAKPSHGGILPGAKVTREIAQARMVDAGEDCISPAGHSAFSDPQGLLHFLQELRELSQGKPVGFKLCVGKPHEFMAIVKAMRVTNIKPDFITVDGAEGGTGAAPFEFSDSVGMALIEGLDFVNNVLTGAGLRDDIRLIASGKVISGFDIVARMALGADMINMARPMMFAIGCIQARRCHENSCPSGVATQDPQRGAAIDVELKSHHVKNFHEETLTSVSQILGAMGYNDPARLTAAEIYRRLDNGKAVSYAEFFTQLKPGQLLGENIPEPYAVPWQQASAEHF
ncbi:MAG: FMN-binding glutamate synthase family protein [Ketobacteraceae bacterium]|nr:FMN-binding glutamate synthase family protein [Ketobacteraceae bacterium]